MADFPLDFRTDLRIIPVLCGNLNTLLAWLKDSPLGRAKLNSCFTRKRHSLSSLSVALKVGDLPLIMHLSGAMQALLWERVAQDA
jgi:hypothetical protein